MCDDQKRVGELPKCNQCVKGFYLFEGKCLEKCEEGTITDTTNYICLPKKQSKTII